MRETVLFQETLPLCRPPSLREDVVAPRWPFRKLRPKVEGKEMGWGLRLPRDLGWTLKATESLRRSLGKGQEGCTQGEAAKGRGQWQRAAACLPWGSGQRGSLHETPDDAR